MSNRLAKKIISAALSAATLAFVMLPAAAGEGAPTASSLKVVKLASLEWPPYIGPSLKDNGYVYQLVERAFRVSGYELEVNYYPWARALHSAKTAALSGVFPEYYSPSREEHFVFSDPFPCGPVSLYKQVGGKPEFKTSPAVDEEQALRELSQYRFGVVRGYINTEALDSAEFLQREEARSDELNLRKLEFGRIDLVAIDPYVARYLLSTTLAKSKGKLERMQPALDKKSLYIAFSRRDENHQELITAFNAGLAKLRSSGELETLLRDYDFDELADEVAEE